MSTAAHQANMSQPTARSSPWTVFAVFLRLGLTSFGGPIAHLGYFRAEFVERRGWLDDRGFSDVVALCQFLPGPASSQVGMAIGLGRAGWLGLLAAWTGFTLPSALLLMAFAYGIARFGALADSGAVHGLKVAAVAVVAQAVWGMGRSLCPDRLRAAFAILAALLTLTLPSAMGQVCAIALGGLLGWRYVKRLPPAPSEDFSFGVTRATGVIALSLFVLLLLGLPLLAVALHSPMVSLASGFYRAGALVFGGGHVVLPLLQAETVAPGWVTPDSFLAGYGLTQAVPGPLFTFSAYLGAVSGPAPHGVAGAAIALAGIFLPGLLLVYGTLPFWDALRRRPFAQAAMRGANAAVVGILAMALYNPVWISAVLTPRDFALAAAGFALLMLWKLPPWVIVLLLGAAGGMSAL